MRSLFCWQSRQNIFGECSIGGEQFSHPAKLHIPLVSHPKGSCGGCGIHGAMGNAGYNFCPTQSWVPRVILGACCHSTSYQEFSCSSLDQKSQLGAEMPFIQHSTREPLSLSLVFSGKNLLSPFPPPYKDANSHSPGLCTAHPSIGCVAPSSAASSILCGSSSASTSGSI